MTQVFGMVLMTLALVLNLVVFLVTAGLDDEVTPFIGVAVLMAVITFLVWRFDALWSRILGLIAGLGLFVLTFFFAFGILQVFSPLEFFSGLMYLVGFVFVMVGGIRSIIAGRRGVEATDGEARLRKRLVTGIAALTVVSIVGFFFTRDSVSDAEASGAVALDMVNFEFDPQTTTVEDGGKLLLHNSDAFVHDFTLDALGIAVKLGPGGDALVDLSDAAPGDYSFLCTLHTDSDGQGMTGLLNITG